MKHEFLTTLSSSVMRNEVLFPCKRLSEEFYYNREIYMWFDTEIRPSNWDFGLQYECPTGSLPVCVMRPAATFV